MTPLQKKLKSYAKKIKGSQSVIDRGMTDILRRNKTFLKELNTSQLIDGINEEGDKIGNSKPYRSPVYADYKNALNPLAGIGNPDLILTGDYSESITAIIKNREIQMIATDVKADDLAHYKGIGIAAFNNPDIANLIRKLYKLKL